MSIPRGSAVGLVRPGEGVPVVQEDLAPIRDALSSGTYVVDEYAQRRIREALDDPGTSKDAAKAILDLPSNKGFKNALTSLVMEQVWAPYSELATGEDVGLYGLQFDGNEASLVRQPAEITASLPLDELADRIAASNQDMATYFVCNLFSDGKVPDICGNAEKDRAYFDAFREQTELQITRTKHYFKTIPQSMDSPSIFIASGLQSIRTHAFGIPNLIDGVSASEDTELTANQHRIGVGNTFTRGITPYFLPNGSIMMTINSKIADPETGRLLPDRWMSNRNPDHYFVFPRPELVRSGNQAAAQRDDLPVQTGCPVVHSRVSSMEALDTGIPLIRSLGQIILRQLDALYYPQRQGKFR